MKRKIIFFAFIAVLQGLSFSLFAQSTVIYDVVLSGGRVIDPETKLDAIRNVGILNNRIAQISSEPLNGKETINASGLVVAPGFIDPHIHGLTNKEQVRRTVFARMVCFPTIKSPYQLWRKCQLGVCQNAGYGKISTGTT